MKQIEITGFELTEILIDIGAKLMLEEMFEELEEIREDHPKAVGLTLARAILQKHMAEKQADISRRVLKLAAINNLPLDGHSITSSYKDGVFSIRAVPEE